MFRWLLPTWGSYSRAAAVHDLVVGCVEEGRPLPNVSDRLRCDQIFWEATGVCGTPMLLRALLYLSVRVRSWTV